MKKRIFISTGEVSGDLQGALLVKALFQQAEALGFELEITALGGRCMEAAGAKLFANTTEIGSVGPIEALPYILPTLKIQRNVKAYLRENPPDLFVMIDYMDANINIGKMIRQFFPQVPTVFFIAPQEWVVSLTPNKTQWIISISDRILAIFPQEERYYTEKGAKVTFVGHPLLDRMPGAIDRETARTQLGIAPHQTAIVLLPASRQQELKYLMPVMFEAAQKIQAKIPDATFLIPVSLVKYKSEIERAVAQFGLRAQVLDSESVSIAKQACSINFPLGIIAAADLAIAKSGTVNLETALLNVPQVVMYRVSSLTAWIAKHILKLKIPFVSPPNLVNFSEIVPEFLQDDATPDNLANAALELLDPQRRQQMLADYQTMRQALGEVGVCDRAAQAMLDML